METIHHFELTTQVLFGEVVQHPGIHQTLHEGCAILGQAKTWQPIVTDPLMVHIAYNNDD